MNHPDRIWATVNGQRYTVYTIDPERITSRTFGGPHFRRFVMDRDNLYRCPETGKAWRPCDIARGWLEGRNVPSAGGGDG